MTRVVSVREVEAAAAVGRSTVAVESGAVITPAARERAQELGVHLTTTAAGTAHAAAPPAAPEAAAPRAASQGAAPAVDPITLDIIENALKNARQEMDAVLYRTAMSPVIRDQHDEFPMIADHQGRMIVGQFGSYISELTQKFSEPIRPGDVILCSDPYLCGGAISHVNDWMVLLPVFHGEDLVGWTSMFGHQMDVGGPVTGSVPTGATSIFGEGLRIPPLKLFSAGQLNQPVMDLIMNNVRMPAFNRGDLLAIVAGCRAGEKRVLELCDRFGTQTYRAACQALLDRTYTAMQQLIVSSLPEEPQSFEDFIDDDGLGNGPYRLKLTIWRQGEHAYFDWTGTDPQAMGPINFYLNEGMFKMFIGVYMIMLYDPTILFNDGFYPLLHVTIPEGSLLQPRFPAPLGCRTHTLARLFDVLGGALSRKSPQYATAAGYGTSPYLLYSGYEGSGEFFYMMEINYGGIPGRPLGDGLDGHAWWPLFANIPTEYLEAYYPIRIERYLSYADSGGAGAHRGGNGVEKVYTFLEPGEISIHDDRWFTRPWGIRGGKPGARSSKMLVARDGRTRPLPAKCDHVLVEPGDQLVYRTAGSGGWGDPLEREAALVARDVRRGLLTAAAAGPEYGVVLAQGRVDEAETAALRERVWRERPPLAVFDRGPDLGEVRQRCLEETGLEPPRPPRPLHWVRPRGEGTGPAAGDSRLLRPRRTAQSWSQAQAAVEREAADRDEARRLLPLQFPGEAEAAPVPAAASAPPGRYLRSRRATAPWQETWQRLEAEAADRDEAKRLLALQFPGER